MKELVSFLVILFYDIMWNSWMSCGFVLLLQEASGLLWSTGVGDGLNLRKMWHVRYLFTTLVRLVSSCNPALWFGDRSWSMQLLTLLFLVLSKVHLQFSSSIRDGLEMTTLCFTMSRSGMRISISSILFDKRVLCSVLPQL